MSRTPAKVLLDYKRLQRFWWRIKECYKWICYICAMYERDEDGKWGSKEEESGWGVGWQIAWLCSRGIRTRSPEERWGIRRPRKSWPYSQRPRRGQKGLLLRGCLESLPCRHAFITFAVPCCGGAKGGDCNQEGCMVLEFTPESLVSGPPHLHGSSAITYSHRSRFLGKGRQRPKIKLVPVCGSPPPSQPWSLVSGVR